MTTEELSKQLFMSNDNEECHWEHMPKHVKRTWGLTASYVQRLIKIAELKARIDEEILSPYHSIWVINRIAKLKEELATLEGSK